MQNLFFQGRFAIFAAKFQNNNMVELQYPDKKDKTETFPLIDEAGNVVGRASRAYCHGGSMALHPVVHLHITDLQGRLYLQKRSMKKDIAPGLWDTAVGGHVDFGETLDEAVRREAREELGLRLRGEPRFLFQYVWKSSRERELVTAYHVVFTGKITPDMDEVDEGRFWDIDELKQQIGKEVFTQQFEQKELKYLMRTLCL